MLAKVALILFIASGLVFSILTISVIGELKGMKISFPMQKRAQYLFISGMIAGLTMILSLIAFALLKGIQ